MFLSVYHFDGDPAALVAVYDVLRQRFPPETFELHVCVVNGTGITVYDACPTRGDFEGFSVSDGLRDAVAGAGLSTPRIAQLGEVHHAVAGKSVGRLPSRGRRRQRHPGDVGVAAMGQVATRPRGG